jgi:hypothetical protein
MIVSSGMWDCWQKCIYPEDRGDTLLRKPVKFYQAIRYYFTEEKKCLVTNFRDTKILQRALCPVPRFGPCEFMKKRCKFCLNCEYSVLRPGYPVSEKAHSQELFPFLLYCGHKALAHLARISNVLVSK